jgi:hypothetical protein
MKGSAVRIRASASFSERDWATPRWPKRTFHEVPTTADVRGGQTWRRFGRASLARRTEGRAGEDRTPPAAGPRPLTVAGTQARGCLLWRDRPWARALSPCHESDTSEKHHCGDRARGTDARIGPLEAVDPRHHHRGCGRRRCRAKPANTNPVVRPGQCGRRRWPGCRRGTNSTNPAAIVDTNRGRDRRKCARAWSSTTVVRSHTDSGVRRR